MDKCTTCNTEKVYKQSLGFPGNFVSICPHDEELWHTQVQRIQHEMLSCASPTIRGLMQVDIDVILERKEASGFWRY